MKALRQVLYFISFYAIAFNVYLYYQLKWPYDEKTRDDESIGSIIEPSMDREPDPLDKVAPFNKETLSSWKYAATPPDEVVHPAELSPDITVVTAFINIGQFLKGVSELVWRKPEYYYEWMNAFTWMVNPLVVYIETDKDFEAFQHVRSFLPHNRTSVIRINRDELWSFRDVLPKVKKIFETPGYPKFHPNTIIPEYSCIMHAKYELMYRTVVENPFKTKYFSWIDVGLYRELVDKQTASHFKVGLPPAFDESRIAYAEVYKMSPTITPFDVFLLSRVWVCGCFFLAKHSVMLKWTTEYKKYTEYFINNNIMNTDEQIIYAMQKTDQRPGIEVQAYPRDDRYTGNKYFHLGYLCKEDIAYNCLKEPLTPQTNIEDIWTC